MKLKLSIIFIGIILSIGLIQANFDHQETGLLANITEKEDNEGIVFFHGSWKEVKDKAKQENKMIFMDAYASWCRPCKMMAKKIFTKAEVGQFFNQHFINVKMDMEKGEGVQLAKKLQLKAYPTLYFFNPSGRLVKKSIGYHKENELLKIAREVING